jgi:hypothetical protein
MPRPNHKHPLAARELATAPAPKPHMIQTSKITTPIYLALTFPSESS